MSALQHAPLPGVRATARRAAQSLALAAFVTAVAAAVFTPVVAWNVRRASGEGRLVRVEHRGKHGVVLVLDSGAELPAVGRLETVAPGTDIEKRSGSVRYLVDGIGMNPIPSWLAGVLPLWAIAGTVVGATFFILGPRERAS